MIIFFDPMVKRTILDYFKTKIQSGTDKEENNMESSMEIYSDPVVSVRRSRLIDSDDENNSNITKMDSKVINSSEEIKVINSSEENKVVHSQGDILENEPHTDIFLETAEDQYKKIKIENTFISKNLTKSQESTSFLECSPPGIKEQERYPFLLDVRDANGIKKGEPGYDPSTLYIPESYYKKFTPFEKQFWDIKKVNFDTVIMFKKGAFYELYEDDAELSSRLFDFKLTDRVNMKMAGFPEKSYDLWASKFLSFGYKIGRVEQAENMLGKKIREAKEKNEKENKSKPKDKIIARELKEIITIGTIYSTDYLDGAQPFYLAVIISADCQNTNENIINSNNENICENMFNNSSTCTNHYYVLLYDASTNKIFYKSICDQFDNSTLKSVFIQNDIREVITDIKGIKNIFTDKKCMLLRPILDKVSSARKYDFCCENFYTCYGYLFNYMKSLCREKSVEIASISELSESKNIILDGASLLNLDILNNNFDGSESYSLFKTINFCSTAFGQRLLRKWILSPLNSISKIEERRKMASVFDNYDLSILIGDIRAIGDAERFMDRMSNMNPSLKDMKMFLNSISKMVIFLNNLNGFFEKNNQSMADKSKYYSENLGLFLNKFGLSFKITENSVDPGESNGEYFNLTVRFKNIEQSLDDFLNNLIKSTGIKSLVYKNINSEIYTIEATLGESLPNEFYVVSATKTSRRYYSPKLKLLVQSLQETEEMIFQCKETIFRKSVDFIDPFKLKINEAIHFVAVTDCYMSFSIFNKITPTCKAIFLSNNSRPVIKGLKNPLRPDSISNDYMPNNKISLVSGPNMGGKSTYLRSICLNIILAQIGLNCFCESISIPVFDAIFTRIGASDSLARGESTFMTELNEASRILRTATSKSFIIMDELGRGTATEDGNAIARAVLDFMKEIGCYTIFSTHYHQLISDYNDVDKLYLESSVEGNDLIFLYKVRHGICLDSQGLHVARMAGIPEEIINRAMEIRKTFVDNK